MQIYLLLNTTCNLACPYCIRGRVNENGDFLDYNAWAEVLKSNKFTKCNLVITGGEPTLHKDINQIIDLCQGKFHSISINSNGVKNDWLDHLNNKIHVQISLDGTENIQNTIRGNEKFNVYASVIATIQKLEVMNISYNISSTVSKRNYSNIPPLMQLVSHFPKMQYWKVSPQLPFGCGNMDDFVDAEEWNRLVAYLVENATVPLDIKKYFDFELLDKFIASSDGQHVINKVNCGDVRHKVYVYPDLTVYPCTCLTDFPLGNLSQNLLSDILGNETSMQFSNYTINKSSYCYNCKYLPYCNGGCIGMSYHLWGKIGEGDYRCPILKANHIS